MNKPFFNFFLFSFFYYYFFNLSRIITIFDLTIILMRLYFYQVRVKWSHLMDSMLEKEFIFVAQTPCGICLNREKRVFTKAPESSATCDANVCNQVYSQNVLLLKFLSTNAECVMRITSYCTETLKNRYQNVTNFSEVVIS